MVVLIGILPVRVQLILAIRRHPEIVRDEARTSLAGRSRFIDRLTDRQLEVVRTAYHAGYFTSPRESTGEEIAAALDISSQAFYQHIRAAQRKLFEAAFADLNELVVE